MRLVARLSMGLIVVAAVIFLPAGTFRFWQGWTCLAIFFVPPLFAYIYFLEHDPQLIERRLQLKENVKEQRLLMRFAKPFFLAALLIPGFDHRFGWSTTLLGAVPLWLTLLAQAMALGAILSVAWVTSVNHFAASTIKVERDQKVISTGPYSLVRHPMYAGGLVLFLFTPLALGSWVALPVFALLIPLLVFRLLNEEKVLRQELPGYTEYCLHTRYRLIPLVW